MHHGVMPLNEAQRRSLCEALGRGTLSSALAIDGKMIRNVIGVVTLANHEDGVAHAMTLMSEKGGDYLFQIKGNRPKLLQHAQNRADHKPAESSLPAFSQTIASNPKLAFKFISCKVPD